MTDLIILIPTEGESWSSFARRAKETEGELLLILSGPDDVLAHDNAERQKFLESCLSIRGRVRLATKRPAVISAARLRGFRVFSRTSELREFLADHADKAEVMRVFSPHLWRQELRTRLQKMGLLSLPKLRVWFLISLSFILFIFVVFKLLPSATISIKPREDSLTHTVNIFLVQSGAVVPDIVPGRVHTMELIPLVATPDRTLTFDQISKEFSGKSATVAMTIINTSAEPFSFRKGTRLTNEAGMIFRIQKSVIIPPGEKVTVPSMADPEDTYREIIGERGNIPAGLKWTFPGLSPEDQKLVYAENPTGGSGGATSFRFVLRKEDLVLARKQLEEELLTIAKQQVDEERQLRDAANPGQQLEVLNYEELMSVEYRNFVLPEGFIGQEVKTVPVEGAITYKAFAYDKQGMLKTLSDELVTHVRDGKRMIESSMILDRLVVHVIDYEDDLSWIKLTVDLTGTEVAILDPLSPTGASFAKQVRDRVGGKTRSDAIRIIKNLPEVDRVSISLWPPWGETLPEIASHIYIEPLVK